MLDVMLDIDPPCVLFDELVKKVRHSRVDGNPGTFNHLKRLDSRFHGNDKDGAFFKGLTLICVMQQEYGYSGLGDGL